VSSKGSRAGKGSRGAGVNGGRGASGRAARPGAPEGKRKRGRPTRADVTAIYTAFPGERVIHRYANRRYYDLVESRAVTLEQVAELVRQRQSVRVVDVDAGNVDITRRVLGQILVESGGEQLELLPVELLRRLIAPLDKGMLAWARQYLSIGAELIDRGAPKGSPRASEAREKLLRLLEDSNLHEQAKQPRPEVKEAPPRTAKQQQLNDRIEELRQRLDDLSKLRGY
jgi:polyhydroxyalkanoate synthesis repressor PhaR